MDVSKGDTVHDTDEQEPRVNVKAVLVDPGSMTVEWMNEAASQDFSHLPEGSAIGLPVDEALHMTGAIGVPEAVRAVATTGMPRHLRTDLVSTGKGSLAIGTSIYLLPDGKLLVLTENVWQAGHRAAGEGGARRSGRRAR